MSGGNVIDRRVCFVVRRVIVDRRSGGGVLEFVERGKEE
jgi:hypothetical protein